MLQQIADSLASRRSFLLRDCAAMLLVASYEYVSLQKTSYSIMPENAVLGKCSSNPAKCRSLNDSDFPSGREDLTRKDTESPFPSAMLIS